MCTSPDDVSVNTVERLLEVDKDCGKGSATLMTSKHYRSTEGCSKLKRSVDTTSSGKYGLNIRTNASPKWDRTRCPEE